jgi:hypothetical protein
MTAIFLGLLGLTGLARSVEAAIILRPPVRVTQIPDPRWRYSVDAYLVDEMDFDPEIRPGDFFTIYDIPGLIPGINFVFDANGNIDLFWAATFEFLGTTPDFSPFPPPIDDDPNILNVSFRWTGDFNIRVPNGESEIFLGNFNVVAISELEEIPAILEYAGQTSIQGSDEKAANAGIVPTVVTVIPEPSSLMLVGIGVSVVTAGVAARRGRRRAGE